MKVLLSVYVSDRVCVCVCVVCDRLQAIDLNNPNNANNANNANNPNLELVDDLANCGATKAARVRAPKRKIIISEVKSTNHAFRSKKKKTQIEIEKNYGRKKKK